MIIVVLFIQAILLLYLLWQPKLSDLSVRDIFSAEAQVPTAEELISPIYAAVSNGDGVYSVYYDQAGAMLSAAESEIRALFESGVSDTQQITRDQYYQAMKEWESVQIEIGAGLPLSDFCSYFSGYSLDGEGSPARFDVLSFSNASKESFFAMDRDRGLYYRIVFSEERESVAAISEVGTSPRCSGYEAGDILGGKGTALIMLGLESSQTPVGARLQLKEEDHGFKDEIAKRLFGETFDFVRRITDSFGNMTYMYGFGQKTLYAPVEGDFIYTDEVREGSQTGFFDDLAEAVLFLSECRALELSGGLGLELTDCSESPDEKNISRTFVFCQTYNGIRIGAEEGCAARVTVTSGQVSEASWSVLSVKEQQSTQSPAFAAEAANVIASNANHIYNILNNKTLAVDSDEAFTEAAQRAGVLVPGYFASLKDEELTPCWRLETDGNTAFYFDLYSGLPLGFSR